MRLLGKKHGDTRIVALCNNFHRLLIGVLAPALREWGQKVRLAGDLAVVGKRAEDEVAKRMLRVECAKCSGQQVALILRHISKFLDSLDIVDTIDDAKDLGFPIVPLALGAIMHRSPQILVHSKCVGRTIKDIGRSYLAGCTLATSLARSRTI